jgi:hypothetical protein
MINWRKNGELKHFFAFEHVAFSNLAMAFQSCFVLWIFSDTIDVILALFESGLYRKISTKNSIYFSSNQKLQIFTLANTNSAKLFIQITTYYALWNILVVWVFCCRARIFLIPWKLIALRFCQCWIFVDVFECKKNPLFSMQNKYYLSIKQKFLFFSAKKIRYFSTQKFVVFDAKKSAVFQRKNFNFIQF